MPAACFHRPDVTTDITDDTDADNTSVLTV